MMRRWDGEAWISSAVEVWLPLHTKQQVSGREAGDEQVIGWHVFRAQKIFPFWKEQKKKDRITSKESKLSVIQIGINNDILIYLIKNIE